jgi:hypothetical protein
VPINGENTEYRFVNSLGSLKNRPRQIPLVVAIFFIIGVMKKRPEHRPVGPPGGGHGYVKGQDYIDGRGIVGVQVSLFKDEKGPEEEGFLIIIFFGFVAGQGPYFPTVSSPSFGKGKNRPKEGRRLIFLYPGTSVQGPKKKADFILAVP